MPKSVNVPQYPSPEVKPGIYLNACLNCRSNSFTWWINKKLINRTVNKLFSPTIFQTHFKNGEHKNVGWEKIIHLII